MKYLLASDIHGSAYYCDQLLKAIGREQPGRIILLGDLLYHGPRNDLPKDYAPKKVIEMLNPLRDKLLCVRGNCDTEVDQMVLDFPILADYAVLDLGGRIMYMTHGHIYGEENPPRLCAGDILMCGHTHVPKCAAHDGYRYLNPGSVSIPKENSSHSYMTYESGRFVWKELEHGLDYMRYFVD